jgi:hypothetical protein
MEPLTPKKTSTTKPTLVRRPLRKKLFKKPLGMVAIQPPRPAPIVVPPPPPPKPPEVIVGRTPLGLLKIWEEKIPWLNAITQVPHQSKYIIRNAPPHKAASVIATEAPHYTQTSEANMPYIDDRMVFTDFQNEYYYERSMPLGYDSTIKWENYPVVSLQQMNLRRSYNTPVVDLRTKLFALLAGMYELSFGYDPEFFAKNPADCPALRKDIKPTNGWVPDGLAWEAHCSIGAPRCFNVLLNQWGKQMIGLTLNNPSGGYYNADIRIPLSPSARLDITPEMQEQLPPDSLKLGCNPSENIYGLAGDLATASRIPRRWGGGHVHVTLPENCRNERTVIRSIRNIDAIAGVALVSMVGAWDDTERRLYYGQAGEFRTKPYGFEYRTPSNQMWTNSYVLYAFLEVLRMVTKMAIAGLDYEDIGFDTTEEEVIRIIQDNNIELARAVIDRNLAVYAAIFDGKSHLRADSFTPVSVLLGQTPNIFKVRSASYDALPNVTLALVYGSRGQLSGLSHSAWPEAYNHGRVLNV